MAGERISHVGEGAVKSRKYKSQSSQKRIKQKQSNFKINPKKQIPIEINRCWEIVRFPRQRENRGGHMDQSSIYRSFFLVCKYLRFHTVSYHCSTEENKRTPLIWQHSSARSILAINAKNSRKIQTQIHKYRMQEKRLEVHSFTLNYDCLFCFRFPLICVVHSLHLR